MIARAASRIPLLSGGPRPDSAAEVCGLQGYCSTVSRSLSSPEQYAVQELTKAAMSGVGIDGEVLSYLELAQVCNNLPFTL